MHYKSILNALVMASNVPYYALYDNMTDCDQNMLHF